MSSYLVEDDRLIHIFEALQQRETAPGQWSLGGTNLPSGQELQEKFPLVGRFLDQHAEPTVSRLLPQHVAELFGEIYS
jgi:hypothetical protein